MEILLDVHGGRDAHVVDGVGGHQQVAAIFAISFEFSVIKVQVVII